MKTMYHANDGKVFETEELCLQHEDLCMEFEARCARIATFEKILISFSSSRLTKAGYERGLREAFLGIHHELAAWIADKEKEEDTGRW